MKTTRGKCNYMILLTTQQQKMLHYCLYYLIFIT